MEDESEYKQDEIQRTAMKNRIIKDFGFDALVAEYALIMVKYKSVEEAVNVIFGDEGGIQHPFFGYEVDQDYQAADNELALESHLECFLCQKP